MGESVVHLQVIVTMTGLVCFGGLFVSKGLVL
jgi:hypothetical protein